MKAMQKEKAFSLVEVTIALGIVAFGLVAVLGLIPVGLNAARDAVSDTRTSQIAQDASIRAATIFAAFTTPVSLSSGTTQLYYDSEGRFLAHGGAGGVLNYGNLQYTTADYAKALYLVTITCAEIKNYPSSANYALGQPVPAYPANVGVSGSATLGVAKIDIGWPVNSDGTVSKPARVSFPVYVRTPWP